MQGGEATAGWRTQRTVADRSNVSERFCWDLPMPLIAVKSACVSLVSFGAIGPKPARTECSFSIGMSYLRM